MLKKEMKYQKPIKLIKVAFITLLISCSSMKRIQNNNLLGTWTGKIPETSAILVFKNDGSGSITYKELNKHSEFKYEIKHDSVVHLFRAKNESKHFFKITNNKLQLSPIKNYEESIEIINEFEFTKVRSVSN